MYRFVKSDPRDDRDIGLEIEDATRNFVAKFPECAAVVLDYCRHPDERDWVLLDLDTEPASHAHCLTYYLADLSQRGIVLVDPKDGFQVSQGG
jgi:hypothetical protein